MGLAWKELRDSPLHCKWRRHTKAGSWTFLIQRDASWWCTRHITGACSSKRHVVLWTIATAVLSVIRSPWKLQLSLLFCLTAEKLHWSNKFRVLWSREPQQGLMRGVKTLLIAFIYSNKSSSGHSPDSPVFKCASATSGLAFKHALQGQIARIISAFWQITTTIASFLVSCCWSTSPTYSTGVILQTNVSAKAAK